MSAFRTRLARDRRAPPGFVLPCQPVLSRDVPHSPHWIHEIKSDGYRIVAYRDRNRIRLWSRTGRDWCRSFTGITAAIADLPDGLVLDGEAIVERLDGRTSFSALQTQPERAILIVWDILYLGYQDLRSLPYLERRAWLEQVLGDPADDRVRPTDIFTDGPALFRAACRHGFEGIVSKRTDARYRSGRDDRWRKIKCPDYRRPT